MTQMIAATTTATDVFGGVADERTVMLTTYRRDGRSVGTPVHIAVVGPRAYVRTFDPSGKLKRMRGNHEIEIAPCTLRGRVTGQPMRATARVLEGEESERAGRVLAGKYPLLHGRLIPWYHRHKGFVTTQIELSAP